MTTRPSSRTSRARRRRFATSAAWRVCREGRGREEREEETMLTEVWMVPLVVIALTETAVVATSVYLHRALAHRALAMHPVADVFFRTVLWLMTGQRRQEWVAVHRKHHAFTDREGDPHSPRLLGLWRRRAPPRPPIPRRRDQPDTPRTSPPHPAPRPPRCGRSRRAVLC